MENEDRICALCRWNRMVGTNFFCGNPDQKDLRLRHDTRYNDGCRLFEESEDRMDLYDFEKKPKL